MTRTDARLKGRSLYLYENEWDALDVLARKEGLSYAAQFIRKTLRVLLMEQAKTQQGLVEIKSSVREE